MVFRVGEDFQKRVKGFVTITCEGGFLNSKGNTFKSGGKTLKIALFYACDELAMLEPKKGKCCNSLFFF